MTARPVTTQSGRIRPADYPHPTHSLVQDPTRTSTAGIDLTFYFLLSPIPRGPRRGFVLLPDLVF